MKPNLPPWATFLLAQAYEGQNQEALLGDLEEFMAAGHSQRWLWKQVLVAASMGFRITLQAHPFLALRAA
jgi:hypothetical protein